MNRPRNSFQSSASPRTRTNSSHLKTRSSPHCRALNIASKILLSVINEEYLISLTILSHKEKKAWSSCSSHTRSWLFLALSPQMSQLLKVLGPLLQQSNNGLRLELSHQFSFLCSRRVGDDGIRVVCHL